MPSESTSYTFMFSVTKILLANDDFNYAGVLNGNIVFQIADQVVISIVLVHQVVILDFTLLAKWLY